MLKIFDSHAHYNDKAFDGDRDELLKEIHSKGIDRIVNVSYDMDSAYKTVEISNKYPFIFGTVGVHPHDAKEVKNSDYDELRKLAANEKIVAIGETGLDYHYDNSPRDVQKIVFANQLSLAEELKMPVVIHEREAVKDTLDILKSSTAVGAYHCFSGSIETARIALNLGYYISFSGVVTYNNAKNVKEAAAFVPADRILVETDCPYLSPVPKRGERNNSSNLIYTLEEIASLRGISIEEAAEITYNNTLRCFGIKA